MHYKNILISICILVLLGIAPFAQATISAGWSSPSTSAGYIYPNLINGSTQKVSIGKSTNDFGDYLEVTGGANINDPDDTTGSLTVNNGTTITDSLTVANSSSWGVVPSVQIRQALSQSADMLDITNNSGGTDFTVLANGNTGIGSTTPGTLFSLGNTGSNTINISSVATSTFGSGLNLRSGCFAVNGTCVGAGGSSQWTTSGSNIYYTGGKVGVGTTTPFSTLSVSTTTQNNGALPLFTVASTTNATLLTVLGNGTVGVGVKNPLYTLDVNGDIYSNSVITSLSGMIAPSINNGGLGLTVGDSDPTITIGDNSDLYGGIKLVVGASGTGVYEADDSGTHFIVNGAGNVGVATTTPPTALSVGGNGYFTGGLGAGFLNSTAGSLELTGGAIIATSTTIGSVPTNSATTSFSTIPTTAGRNDNDYAIGFNFTVNSSVTVSRLGRLYVSGNSQNHVIKIWNNSNTVTPVVSATILAASASDSNGFKWVAITPVTLTPGNTYSIAIDENAAGDTWKDIWNPILKDSFTLNGYAYQTGHGAFPANQGSDKRAYSTPAMDFTTADPSQGYALNVIGSGNLKTAKFDSPFGTQVVINTNQATDGTGVNAPLVIEQNNVPTLYMRQDGAIYPSFMSTIDNATAAVVTPGTPTGNVNGIDLAGTAGVGIGWTGGSHWYDAWDTFLGRSSAGVLQIQTPGGGAGAGGLLAGQIGIGTSTPYATLSVQSNASTGDAFAVATSSKNAVFGVDNDGHQFTSGPAPVISSCGTGTGTVVGDDQSGTITTATAATACTMTFAKAYRATPTCTVTDNSLVGFADISSISTSAVTFGISSALTGGNLYYSCKYHK